MLTLTLLASFLFNVYVTHQFEKLYKNNPLSKPLKINGLADS